MNPGVGKYMIVAGILIIVAGVIVYFFHDRLHWLGRLPGDIRIEKTNFRFYFPFTTLALISVLLSLLLWLFRKL